MEYYLILALGLIYQSMAFDLPRPGQGTGVRFGTYISYNSINDRIDSCRIEDFWLLAKAGLMYLKYASPHEVRPRRISQASTIRGTVERTLYPVTLTLATAL